MFYRFLADEIGLVESNAGNRLISKDDEITRIAVEAIPSIDGFTCEDNTVKFTIYVKANRNLT